MFCYYNLFLAKVVLYYPQVIASLFMYKDSIPRGFAYCKLFILRHFLSLCFAFQGCINY